MPLRLILFGLLLIALVNWLLPLSPNAKRKLARGSLWFVAAGVLLLLIRIGMARLAIVGAGLYAVLRWVLPVAVRLLPLLALRRSAPRTGGEAQGAEAGRAPAPDPRSMTRAQALQVLDLQEGATREQIVTAYRDLIRKVHPDKGGSSYLAAQVNRARDVLLSQRQG